MEKEPFLTIGIASYNYAHYLPTAFAAIRRQRFTDYEVLYCDDGSKDDSVEVIRTLMEENPDISIRLVQGENVGIMGNKNRILENARGKYVMLCDADDNMLDNCLETLCGLAIQTDADQVVGAFQKVDENGNVLSIQEVPKNLSRWTWGVHHATLYKMQIIREKHVRFALNNNFPDDTYFNMVFHDNSKTQAFTNTVVYNWNMHPDSTSGSTKSDNDVWHGYLYLKNSLSFIGPISKKYSGEEFLQIEYFVLKIYCNTCLFRDRGTLKQFLASYRDMRKLMENAFPTYKTNKYAGKIDADKIVRRPTARAIWLFILAERTHTIRLLLALFWFISKNKTFTS